MTMVILNNFVHQRSEGLVRRVGPSVDSNAGVSVLTAGENCCSKVKAQVVCLGGKLLEDLLGAELAQ